MLKKSAHNEYKIDRVLRGDLPIDALNAEERLVLQQVRLRYENLQSNLNAVRPDYIQSPIARAAVRWLELVNWKSIVFASLVITGATVTILRESGILSRETQRASPTTRPDISPPLLPESLSLLKNYEGKPFVVRTTVERDAMSYPGDKLAQLHAGDLVSFEVQAPKSGSRYIYVLTDGAGDTELSRVFPADEHERSPVLLTPRWTMPFRYLITGISVQKQSYFVLISNVYLSINDSKTIAYWLSDKIPRQRAAYYIKSPLGIIEAHRIR